MRFAAILFFRVAVLQNPPLEFDWANGQLNRRD